MKKLSIVLLFALVAMLSCTKNKEVHPEIGDGNDELVTVGINNISIKYIRNDIANLQKVVFHYSITDAQQFNATQMTKTSDCFTLTLNDLQSDTLYSYYYELFPYSGNTSTTNQKTFRTQSSDTPAPPTPPSPPSDVPEGAINGLFTINENGDQVYFSQGNLQYKASTNTWRFAEHQWDYVGGSNSGEQGNVYENGVLCNNTLISATYDGWIDLFGWGTSGYNHGAVCYQPWSIGVAYPPTDFEAYGNYSYNLYDQTGKADWGYNYILNGGLQVNLWRTLKAEEWDYIVNNRNTTSGVRYAKAHIKDNYNTIISNGLLLLPDDWDVSYFNLTDINTPDADYYDNSIYQTEWETVFEPHGAIFLPASGIRFGTDVQNASWRAAYWSSSRVEYEPVTYRTWARCLSFITEDVFALDGMERDEGLSVRLVHDAE